MKTAFVFPGQGSQYVGMGAKLKETFPVAARTFEEADDALGFAISDLIQNGPLESLTATDNNQPAILTVEVAYLRVLQEAGFTAVAAAGHSLGEYAALVATGSLTFTQAVRLVHKRGKFMQDAVPLGDGTMSAALRLEDEVVERLCKEVADIGVVEPAGYNSVGQVVVAGSVAAIAAFEEKVGEAGGMVKRLNVSAPFHCSLLDKAAKDLKDALKDEEIKDPTFPYFANVDAKAVTDAMWVKPRLIGQVVMPVRWVQSMKGIQAMGVERFIEIGPGRTLAGLMRRIDRKAKIISVDKEGVLDALLAEGS